MYGIARKMYLRQWGTNTHDTRLQVTHSSKHNACTHATQEQTVHNVETACVSVLAVRHSRQLHLCTYKYA